MTSSNNTKPSTSNADQFQAILRFLGGREYTADNIDGRADQAVKKQQRTFEIRQQDQTIENLKSDRNLRETQATKVFRFAVGYCSIAAFFVFLSGCAEVAFSLEVPVLVTVAGSTAVAAITQIGFVTRGVFRPPKDEEE